jgi:hypothetical protein
LNAKLEMLKSRDWPALFGFIMFTGMLAAGYYYNLTFIQLGLDDFGSRRLGLSANTISHDMALLALLTCVIAIGLGAWMRSGGVSVGVFGLSCAWLLDWCWHRPC